MKKYMQILTLLLLVFQLQAQNNVQGTVEKVGNIARVSAQSSGSTVTGDLTNMIILLSIEDVYGPVTASVDVNYVNNLAWSTPPGYPMSIMGRRYFLFIGLDNGTSCCPKTFNSGVPEKIIDVAFNNSNIAPFEAPIRLSDLDGTTMPMINEIWYVEVENIDQTNYTNRFFSTPNTGMVVNGPSEWYVETSGLVPLPVELTGINAKWSDDQKTPLVTWHTSSEKDLSHYEIERSSGEKSDYVKVGEVKAAGNSNVPKSYSFADKSSGNERSDLFYYRLRLVDNNGKFSYSPVVSLQRETVYSFQVSPNPNNGLFFLTVTSDFEKLENPSFILTDVAGKMIKNGPVTDVKMQFDMSKSEKGIYFLSILSAGKEVKQYKVVKGEDR